MNIECPLECGSKIKSLYRHMQRCSRKNLFGKEYLKCKYDYNHIVKKEEYEMHLDKCDKSKKIFFKLIMNYYKECYDSEELEVDLQKVFERKKKLSAGIEKHDEEVFYSIQSEKCEDGNSAFTTTNDKEKSDMMFSNENEIDEDSLNFFYLVYTNY